MVVIATNPAIVNSIGFSATGIFLVLALPLNLGCSTCRETDSFFMCVSPGLSTPEFANFWQILHLKRSFSVLWRLDVGSSVYLKSSFFVRRSISPREAPIGRPCLGTVACIHVGWRTCKSRLPSTWHLVELPNLQQNSAFETTTLGLLSPVSTTFMQMPQAFL